MELLVVVVIRYYISIVKKDITKKYIPKSSRHVKSQAPLPAAAMVVLMAWDMLDCAVLELFDASRWE